MVGWTLAILILLAAAACALFGLIYFAGLKSDVAHQYGPAGKFFSIVVTALTIPLFNLGRFMARRRSGVPKDPV